MRKSLSRWCTGLLLVAGGGLAAFPSLQACGPYHELPQRISTPAGATQPPQTTQSTGELTPATDYIPISCSEIGVEEPVAQPNGTVGQVTLVSLNAAPEQTATAATTESKPAAAADNKNSDAKANTDAKAATPKIQVALLLDTSNSMDGLINQARTQLWKVVNEFSKSKLGDKLPQLEVALFEYGNDGLPASEGYIRLVVPFTSDLDKLSKELFALQTNGGSEFCGQTISQAVKTLAWSKADADVHCIFIAGNEPFNQGPVDYSAACKDAAGLGITVSTIHCGDYQTGLQTGWADGAKLADGNYMSINSDEQVADIPTPHDEKLAELSTRLNATYVVYGSAQEQEEFKENQVAQDANAAQAGAGVAATRALSKAGRFYANAQRDLVDGLKDGSVKLEELKDEQLPEEVRKLKPEERKAWVENKGKERAALQEEIKKLATERDAFITAERQKLASADKKTDSLDTAILKAARSQAEKKNYTFE
ncbi:MAG: vWA domain-containing protein [Pirellulales bacterium]|nr:vWA domain-containing protein [Pirellulales bacterium]